MTMIWLIVRGRPRLMLWATGVVGVAATLLGMTLRFLAGLSTRASVMVAAVVGVLALVAFVVLCAVVLTKIMDFARTFPPGHAVAAGPPPDGEASPSLPVPTAPALAEGAVPPTEDPGECHPPSGCSTANS